MYHNNEMDQARNAAPNCLALFSLGFGSSIGSKASGIHLPFYVYNYLCTFRCMRLSRQQALGLQLTEFLSRWSTALLCLACNTSKVANNSMEKKNGKMEPLSMFQRFQAWLDSLILDSFLWWSSSASSGDSSTITGLARYILF